jgi:hypothetical protein
MSDRRRQLESAAIIVSLLLALAFIASAVFGVMHRPKPEEVVVTPPKAVPAPPAAVKGKVEVLNATGKAGLARAATEQLRRAGFDVVFFGTARAADNKSSVIDRVGHLDIANAAAGALRITSVKSQMDTTLLLDATVIIGNDWQKQQAAAQEATATGWKAKVRKWIGHR